jgi:hypothetical protein
MKTVHMEDAWRFARYEIHFIPFSARYKIQVKEYKRYPSADIRGYPNLVIMEIQLRDKKFKKTEQERRWGPKLLMEKDNRERSATAIDRKLGNEKKWASKQIGMN